MNHGPQFFESLRQHLFLPQNFAIGSITFLIIVNALSMRFDEKLELPENLSVIKIDNLQPKSKLISNFQNFLKFEMPERFSCGDYGGRRSRYLMATQRSTSPIGKKDLLYTAAEENERQVHTLIMFAFYMGYAMSHISGLLFSEHCKGAKMLSTSLVGTFFVAVIPWSTVMECNGWRTIIMIRFVTGFGQGMVLKCLTNIRSQNRGVEETCAVKQFISHNGHITILLINLLGTLFRFAVQWIYVYYSMIVAASLWLTCMLILCHCNPTVFVANHPQEVIPYQSVISTHRIPATNPPSTQSLLPTIHSEEIDNFLRPSWWNLTLNTMEFHWTKSLLIAELNNLIYDLRGHHLWDILITILKILIPFLLCWLISRILQKLLQSSANRINLNPRAFIKFKIILASYLPHMFSDYASCLLSTHNMNPLEMTFNCAISVMANIHTNINLHSLLIQSQISRRSSSSIATIVHELGSITNIIAPYFDNLLGEGPLGNMRSVLWIMGNIFITDDNATI
ncbi:uncharacterized protein [Musca autumnalis]|uniref:uncharacterized protein n=1 Tax=Musca autumnalis TaxID=221902 RepID=UPI003CF30EDD